MQRTSLLNFFLCLPGLVQFSIGTSNSVEAAINFLYGQRPKINTDNAESILEAAEFLMIEELKTLCIKKLKSVQVDSNNCLKLLFLTSRYDFYLEKLSDFILSHLPDLLPNDEMLLLDKESVRNIITDPMLSYVSREDYFKYLIRWTGHFAERDSDFPELLACLESEDISSDVLNTVSLDCLSESNKLLCNSLSNTTDQQRNVIIAYPPQYSSGKYFLYAYSPVTKSWYQMLSGDNSDWPNRPGIILTNQNTIVNFRSYRETLTYYNLHTGNKAEKSISVIGDDVEITKTFDQIFANNDKIYCIRNNSCYTEKSESADAEEDEIDVDFMDFIRMQALCGGNEMLALHLLTASRRNKRQMKNICSLYISEEEDDEKVVVTPVISVHGTVKSLCVTDNIACLLIPEMERLVVYAYEQQFVKKLDLSVYKLDDKSYLCPSLHGGVYAVTKSHILQIDIQLNTSSIIANVSEFLIPKQANDDDYWSRINPIKFEVLQDKVIAIEKSRGSYKNMVSYQCLPETVSVLGKEETFEIQLPERIAHESLHFLQATLPKENLRCPLDCPHCKYKETRELRHPAYERDSDSDEYIYYDDSDGYYGYYDSSD